MSHVIPKAIRKADAPHYLGMKRGMFEKYISPLLLEVTIGSGKFYDRVDLDECFNEYKKRSERHQNKGGNQEWRKKQSETKLQALGCGTVSTTYKKSSMASEFTKALEQAHMMKQ